MDPDSYKISIYLAKLAGHSGRYNGTFQNSTLKCSTIADDLSDMLGYIAPIVSSVNGRDLTVEERTLFKMAYHEVAGARRRSLFQLQEVEKLEIGESRLAAISKMRFNVEAELDGLCHGVIQILSKLLPLASSREAQAVYRKM